MDCSGKSSGRMSRSDRSVSMVIGPGRNWTASGGNSSALPIPVFAAGKLQSIPAVRIDPGGNIIRHSGDLL